MFDKLSKKIGFTQTEVQVILFIVVGFIFGLVIKFYRDSNIPEYKHFDYSVQDSLFNYYKNHQPETDSTANNTIDSKQELLEFSSVEFNKNESSTLPGEKSIDINSADEKLLISLPGIGPSTARKILELREKRGKFMKLEELMDVKGIGNIKFKKIEKFLYIK
ncbi:MAG: helix-hairpin-helix domain-containing protein [Ignavibacteria bacterium]|jgi:competence protein ComEA